MSAAEDAILSLRNSLKTKIVRLPKKVRGDDIHSHPMYWVATTCVCIFFHMHCLERCNLKNIIKYLLHDCLGLCLETGMFLVCWHQSDACIRKEHVP